MGMTSVQSIMVEESWPMTAILAIAARNALWILDWLSAHVKYKWNPSTEPKERVRTDVGLPLAGSARVTRELMVREQAKLSCNR